MPSYSKPSPNQSPQCDMYDQNSSAMWRQRIALENKWNEAKEVPTQEDVRSVLLSELPTSSRMSQLSQSSQMTGTSAVSFTSSVVARIEDLQKQLNEERLRRIALEKELAKREARHTASRIFPDRPSGA